MIRTHFNAQYTNNTLFTWTNGYNVSLAKKRLPISTRRLKALRALCRHCFTKFVKSVLTPQLALFRVWESECEQPLSVMAVLLQTILMGQIKMNALGYAFPSDKSHTAC